MQSNTANGSPYEDLRLICTQYRRILGNLDIPHNLVNAVEFVLSKSEALKLIVIQNDGVNNYKGCLEELNKWLVKWIYQVNIKENN